MLARRPDSGAHAARAAATGAHAEASAILRKTLEQADARRASRKCSSAGRHRLSLRSTSCSSSSSAFPSECSSPTPRARTAASGSPKCLAPTPCAGDGRAVHRVCVVLGDRARTYYFWHWSWGVEWRYFDWMFSRARTMLITLFFVQYLHAPEECMTNEQLNGRRDLRSPSSASSSATGLCCSPAEHRAAQDNTAQDAPSARLPSASGETRIHRRHRAGLRALLLAFAPHFVWAADGYGSDWGWRGHLRDARHLGRLRRRSRGGSTTTTRPRCPATSNERARNACYNVLDIFSNPGRRPHLLCGAGWDEDCSCAPVAPQEVYNVGGLAVAWSDKRHGPRRPPGTQRDCRNDGRLRLEPARGEQLVRRRHCRADRRARAARLHDLGLALLLARRHRREQVGRPLPRHALVSHLAVRGLPGAGRDCRRLRPRHAAPRQQAT